MNKMMANNTKTYVALIEKEISRTRERRYIHRLDIILNVLKGADSEDLGNLFGHSPRTINYWVHRFLTNGLAGIREGQRTGRPSRLSAYQLRKLRREIRHSPIELGYDQNLWNGLQLSRHLKKKYSVSLSVRQCQRLIKRLRSRLPRLGRRINVDSY